MSAADDADHEALSLVDRSIPAAFVRWIVTIAPAASHPYVESDWRGALIEVDAGEVVLVGVTGGSLRVGPGAVLWLDGVPLVALHNPGGVPAVLVAVARRTCPSSPSVRRSSTVTATDERRRPPSLHGP